MTLVSMKKNILVCFMFLLFFGSRGLGQSFTFNKKTSEQPEQIGHMSVFNYGFDRSYMVITNEYAKEPAIKYSPAYIHYPYETRKIQLYGPTLGFTITANGNSSDFPTYANWVGAGIPIMDSIFKGAIEARLKNTPGIYKRLSKLDFDSIAKNKKKFDLAALQVRIIKNNKVVRDWKNISQLGTLTQATDVAKGNFVVYYDALQVNDHVVITFRNKSDTSLITFEFERLDSPLFPFLAAFQRDTTSKSYADFVKGVLEKDISKKSNVDEFYQYWPSKVYNMEDRISKDRIFDNTKLAFTFRKPDPGYVDTTMEYLLSAGPIKDSLWQTTGHRLFLSDFKPGTDYTLLIRYKSTRGNIQTYTFHTLPKWYQTTKYKYAIVGVIILVLFSLLFLLSRIRLKKEKKKNAYLQYGLKSIRSQLNPHFIFNALSSIQGLINKNDIPGANHYLTEFSSLLRESLRNNDKELVPLDTELKILETYLKLEQLRFHFQYEIIVDAAIDKNAVEIPALLLQPLIENAIKHGVAGLQEKGTVTIAFNASNKNLVVSIADNGNGFIQNTATQGLGLKLTKDRIHLLNQSFKKQPIQLYIETAYNNGTTVHLGFENWL
ncbi:MAG: histidine kinase [Bacteroidota bacterium]